MTEARRAGYKNNMQHAVKRYHDALGHPAPETLCPPDDALKTLRIALIQEELEEFIEACDTDDFVEMVDALGDILYVTLGAFVALGVDVEPVFNEIQRSNMSKMGPDGKGIVSRGMELDGKPLGKGMKGPNYSEPDIAMILINQSRTDPTLRQDLPRHMQDLKMKLRADYYNAQADRGQDSETLRAFVGHDELPPYPGLTPMRIGTAVEDENFARNGQDIKAVDHEAFQINDRFVPTEIVFSDEELELSQQAYALRNRMRDRVLESIESGLMTEDDLRRAVMMHHPSYSKPKQTTDDVVDVSVGDPVRELLAEQGMTFTAAAPGFTKVELAGGEGFVLRSVIVETSVLDSVGTPKVGDSISRYFDAIVRKAREKNGLIQNGGAE